MGGHAEGAFAAYVHVDGCEAEIVGGVALRSVGQVQVPRHLGNKPATVALLEEVGEFIDEPAVGQSWRGGSGLMVASALAAHAGTDEYLGNVEEVCRPGRFLLLRTPSEDSCCL